MDSTTVAKDLLALLVTEGVSLSDDLTEVEQKEIGRAHV